MNKMEEKLKASIKPKRPAQKMPQPPISTTRKVVAQVVDLNSTDIPLHPQRIWPD